MPLSDKQRMQREEYRDLGKFARHFSTVRMTLATTFIGLSLAVLQLQWEKPERSVQVFALSVWGVGALLFSLFSYETFKAERRQREVEGAFLNDAPADVKKKTRWLHFWRNPSGLPAVIVLTGAFWVLTNWWVQRERHAEAGGFETTVPILIESGASPPARLEVPIKIKVPSEKAGGEKPKLGAGGAPKD
jgi:hypothetical protein